MIKIAKENKESVLQKVREGQVDVITLSTTSLVDDIVLEMHKQGITANFELGFKDKRADNTTVPFNLVFTLAIAAKMKIHSSLTDIPFAITDHRTLAGLGYTLVDTDGKGMKKGLMSEGSLRALLGKYTSSEFIDGYNNTIQNFILPQMNIRPDIHILDCTKLEVNLFNKNYEESGIVKDEDGNNTRGYKLATIRGITYDTGIIEDIRFGKINTHDLKLSSDMVMTSPVLKPGDILINDRGFISRELLNDLKTERQVDTYIPLKSNMEAYEMAVKIAQEENSWTKHPNKERRHQKIAFVSDLGPHWISDNPDKDVAINACVVWAKDKDEYFVFITTDTSKTAKQIVRTYELRPEIEEDYRQLKDFWNLEDFKSTKINVISFHIVSVLLGYLFFQLYTMTPEGEEYAHKSLPVIQKNYVSKVTGDYVIYSGNEFAVLDTFEFAELYSSCNSEIKLLFRKKLGKF